MTDNIQKELFSLISAQHDGVMGEEQSARLAELLEQDADARRFYLELGAMLHELEELYHGHCAELLMDELPRRRARVIPFYGWGLAVAASLAAVFMLFAGLHRPSSELMVDPSSTVLMDESSFVIRVLGSSDLVWGDANTVEIHDDELKHGALDLAAGKLDIMFENGVRFGLVAPVKMNLSSLKRLMVESGSVVVDVPGLADGVTIKTPDSVLMANTARAHIHCAEGENTKVRVEQGAVDVFSENDAGLEVRKSIVGRESVVVARGTARPIENTRWVTEPRIDLSQPPKLDNLQYVHYRFDHPSRGRIESDGSIPNADGWLAGISKFPEYPAPRRVPGRFGNALEFSGHGEGMIADLKDFGTDEPGSVAFWIKLDPGMVPAKYETVFTWRMYTDKRKEWHPDDEQSLACSIHINDNPEKGVVGAPWIAFRNKWICGTKDLRDGRWHHVTAVFHRGYQGTIIRHYIDGELARSSARGRTWYPDERYPEVGGGSITVGRVYWPDRPAILKPSDPVGLQGAVDEVYVFNQAVLPSHASSLYMKNSPNQRVQVSFVPISTPLALIQPSDAEK